MIFIFEKWAAMAFFDEIAPSFLVISPVLSFYGANKLSLSIYLNPKMASREKWRAIWLVIFCHFFFKDKVGEGSKQQLAAWHFEY